jgi:hypothetical protein
MASLGQSASALGRQFQNLTPFAKQAKPALIALGNSSQQSQPALVATLPLAKQLRSLGEQAVPSGSLLDKLLTSIDNTGGIEQLMSLLYNGTNATNGFDELGHYVRTDTLVGDCTGYANRPVLGCSANFKKSSAAAAAASPESRELIAQATNAASGGEASTTALKGLMHYLIGSGR